jgi:hypothetical protein
MARPPRAAAGRVKRIASARRSEARPFPAVRRALSAATPRPDVAVRVESTYRASHALHSARFFDPGVAARVGAISVTPMLSGGSRAGIGTSLRWGVEGGCGGELGEHFELSEGQRALRGPVASGCFATRGASARPKKDRLAATSLT